LIKLQHLGIVALWFVYTLNVFSQTDSTKQNLKAFGFAELYYLHNFNSSFEGVRNNYVFSHGIQNQLSVNLTMIHVEYTKQRFRSAFAIMGGTYANQNLSHENMLLRHVYEARVGVKVSDKHNLWLDLGVFESHIGFENPISIHGHTLSRSLMAENSPYYESGAKLSYTNPNQKWFISLLLLNGWQKFTPSVHQKIPSFGHQVRFKPTENLIVNSSSFVGSDQPDSAYLFRFFHNAFLLWQVHPEIAITLANDVGTQQKTQSGYSWWNTTALILRYKPSEKWAFAARGEYFLDPDQVIISNLRNDEINIVAFSVNTDYALGKYFSLRTELGSHSSRQFLYSPSMPNQQWYWLNSVSVRF